MIAFPQVSALADSGFQEPQAAAVERGRRRIIHLVGGNLEHLVLEIDGVAGGRVWKPLLPLSPVKVCPPPAGAIWLPLVRISASDPIDPPTLAPTLSNLGSTRSCGRKFGASEFEMFSASTRWRS